MNDDFDGVEWDERKSTLNVERRGFGFELAADLFLGDYIENESSVRDLSESRRVAIGCVDNRIITVIWTQRGSNRRIISARLASRKERRLCYGHREEEAL